MHEVRRPREAIWFPTLVLVACGIVTWLVLADEASTARGRVRSEDEALASARQVLEAEFRHREKVGRFAWLSELAEAGNLQEAQRQSLAAAGTHLEAKGFRVDVLLPLRGTAGRVAVGAYGTGAVDASLVSRHVLVVARPTGPEPRGYRSFALDENGRVWVSEAVSDEAARTRNPLPTQHLPLSSGVDPTGLSWSRLDLHNPETR